VVSICTTCCNIEKNWILHTYLVCLFHIIIARYSDCVLACRQLNDLGVHRLSVHRALRITALYIMHMAGQFQMEPFQWLVLRYSSLRPELESWLVCVWYLWWKTRRRGRILSKCLRLSPVSIIPPLPQNHLNFQSFSCQEDKRENREHLPTTRMILHKHQETHLTPEPIW